MPLIRPLPASELWGTHDCRLDYVGAPVSVKLNRFGGQYLMLNGVRQSIPAGGVAASAPNGMCYAWAYMNAGVMSLYFDAVGSGTHPVMDANGMPVHPANPALTIVGITYVTSGALLGGASSVASYWNKLFRSDGPVASSASTSATTPTALNTTYFVGFAGDPWEAFASGHVYSNTTNAIQSTAMGFDGANFYSNTGSTCTPGSSQHVPICNTARGILAATGIHWVQIHAWQNAGTGTWVFYQTLRRMA